MDRPIYLIVKFNFPRPFDPEDGQKAIALHKAVQGQDWIEEILAADGGIGGGPSAIWVFKLNGYASLDRLFGGEDEVSKAYLSFIQAVNDVEDIVRESIRFSS